MSTEQPCRTVTTKRMVNTAEFKQAGKTELSETKNLRGVSNDRSKSSLVP